MRDGLIARICPAEVRVVEVRHDQPGAELPPVERSAIGSVAAARRAEFATGRWCAHRALAELGHRGVAVGRGARGEPVWPGGVVGSITHCAGLRAAAVARDDDVRAIGIDAEPDEPLPVEVLELVASAPERTALGALPAGRVAWDRLLFCAKEAVYKAWFPLGRRFLDFTEATVAIDPAGTFHAVLSPAATVVRGRPVRELDGRWTAGDGLVGAVVVLEPAT